MKRSLKRIVVSMILLLTVTVIAACSDNSAGINTEKPEGAPDTWIADRTITGLVFQSANDASVDMNPEIKAYIKERTGINFELQTVTAEDSTESLASGLAAGDLPDFIAFYLNNSGRPEMQLLLKAANEGMFTDLTPLMEDTETYAKYLEEDYLPADTRDNIMFREEWDGASYLVHMAINREGGYVGRKTVGGLYIKKDVVEALGIDPQEVNTTEDLYELAVQIKEGNFTDHNGNPITVIGPTAWGGSDREWLYNDLVWTGVSGEKFMKDESGEILHEAQTDYGMKRVEHVHQLLDEGLMTPEYYTMEETRAKEGIVNGSFAIVSDMHNYMPENKELTYIPLGPIERVDGTNDMVIPYKSGYAGWAIPSTTEQPEHVMQFADWLASEEGKRLYFYGLEGRDYELDENGNPVVKQEVLDLLESNPEEAKKLGFRGVRAYWGEHLAYTDLYNEADFGELEYGESLREEDTITATQILDYYNYDERLENARVIDGMTVQSFLYEFEGDNGRLTTALSRYNEDILRAYYADSLEQAQQIMNESFQNLESSGLHEFLDFVEQKEAEGTSLKF
ncbi:extracellular solute-binding protein [Oceanobacillus polygoni]|uniref:Aldouronate transport system substrate-binding protein n=1 Tax=Oceanobacillus polygoni TaxID=1235259 RepID=A0A9X0YVU6_9BACI|nr:extracellular solute-binding protein [Oceanobacillus polygoni]MBP2079579.1 putative aldouronate transport system substrate-binding protein [Oceanobacillus polygoni]